MPAARAAGGLSRRTIIATTNHGGAGKWTPAHARHLAGRRVVIIPDADEPGERHAQAVASSLRGIAATKYNVARMFRKDLADARRAWLAAAVDADDRMTREQSDFLGYVNHDGERADFHALRHTCGAWLAMAGNHPKAVQSIMRHSSITLTMDTYGHLFPGAEADAIARLPAMLGDAPQALAATGTDGKAGNMAANRQQYGSKSAQNVAGSCEPSDDDQSGDGQQNVLTFNALSDNLREAAERGGSEAVGTRTRDLRIKSPLLYRLSYNLNAL